MEIALLEPFYAGSHRQWADGLQKHSTHSIECFTLPGRHWKWRMHGGAIALADQLVAHYSQSGRLPDLLLVTSMTDLTVLRALLPSKWASVPAVYYFHENQLVYPWSPTDPDVAKKRDRHYGFIQIASALAADQVWFNSAWHRTVFLDAVDEFLKALPDQRLPQTRERIAQRSQVMHLGLELKPFIRPAGRKRDHHSPVILWNHRWEYDKDPDTFFNALFNLADQELDFRVAVTGESYGTQPGIFDRARERLADRIVHFGYCSSRSAYIEQLQNADILPVTARQDFFGIAVVEAIAAGVTPLLPDDLVYGEHLTDASVLYVRTDFEDRLRRLISGYPPGCETSYSQDVLRYDWRHQARVYDQAFAGVTRKSE